MPARGQHVDEDQAAAAEKAAAARKKDAAKHPPGQMRVYRSFDASAPAGGRERDQLVLVTGHHPDTGHVLGKPLGWADEGASFEPGQLREVGAELDDGGRGDGGG